MNTAIIGGGFAAKLHADAVRKAGSRIALVATGNPESAKRAAREFGAQHWVVCENGTLPEALFDENIDAVHICTPPNVHAPFAQELIRHGKHVLCEKPLSTDAAAAQEMARLARKSNVVAATVLNVRYHAACQRAREIILSGQLGRPLLIHGSYLQEFHALPAPADWRYNPSLAGPERAVTEIGTHWFDIAQYISGRKITAVSAAFGNFFPERQVRDGMMYPKPHEHLRQQTQQPVEQLQQQPVETSSTAESHIMHVTSEDAAAVTLRFEGGAMGSVLLSEISAGRGNRLALEITCENGNLWWNEEDNNRLYTARKGEGIHEELFAFGNGFGDTFEALVDAFYRQIRTAKGEEPSTALPTVTCPSFDEGAQIALVCDAIRRSAQANSAWTQF